MEITKKQDEFGTTIIFKEGTKFLNIKVGGTLDLYWSLHSEDVNKDNEFIITKENYNLYCLFEQLFNDIDNLNIYEDDEYLPFYIQTQSEKEEYEKEIYEQYKVFNFSNYNELFNTDTITWYSDETNHEVANILKIKRDDECFKINFYIQPYHGRYTPYDEKYDRDFNSLHYIPIRFRNSGSRYDPFNIVFMRMYNNMNNLDDVNDYGHQVHMEEYLYNNKVKKLK